MMSDILPVQLTPAVDNAVISIPSTLSLWVTSFVSSMLGRLQLGGLELTLGKARSGASKTCLQLGNSGTLHPSALNCQQKIVRLIPLKGPTAQRLRATQASAPFLFVANNSWSPQWTIFATFSDANYRNSVSFASAVDRLRSRFGRLAHSIPTTKCSV